MPDKRLSDRKGKRAPAVPREDARTDNDEGMKRVGTAAVIGRVASRLIAIAVALFAAGFFIWGLFLSGRVVFLHSVSAEDVTRGFDFGPVWIEDNSDYRARLSMVIPQSGKFWETSFTVLDLNKAEVGGESLFLATTQPEFAPGKRTVRDNFFNLSGESGWHYFRFKQIAGAYPPPGAMGAPVASLEIKSGVVEPKLCYGVLILGLVIGGIILFLTR